MNNGQSQGPKVERGEDIKERLKRLGEWARRNLAIAQSDQKERYDRKVRLREFQPGDRVLLLMPISETKLLAKWQEPYSVKRKLGPVDYELETPDKRKERKIFHVNLLKKWTEREGEASLSEELGPQVYLEEEGTSETKKGESLSETQKQDLRGLEEKY